MDRVGDWFLLPPGNRDLAFNFVVEVEMYGEIEGGCLVSLKVFVGMASEGGALVGCITLWLYLL